MGQNIFNIQEKYLYLLDKYEDIELIENEDEQAEAIAKFEKEVAINIDDFEEKMRNYAYVIFNLKGESTIIDDEIDRLTNLKKSKENTIKRLKEVSRDALLMMGDNGKSGNKVLNLGDIKFYTRKNEVVTLSDEDLFLFDNREYVNATINTKISKDNLDGVLAVINQTLPENEFTDYKLTIDKRRLKADLKDAVEVEGATLVRKDSIIIK